MAKLNRRLFFRDTNNKQKSITLYDGNDNIGENYLVVRVNEHSIGFAQTTPITYDSGSNRIITQGSSELVVEDKNTGKKYAVNYQAEDPTLITNGGGAVNIGAVVTPPTGIGGSYYSYGSNTATSWVVSPQWNAASDSNVISRFKVTIKPHIFLSDVIQFKCLISSNVGMSQNLQSKVISVNQNTFYFDVPAGSYYFKVVAEDINDLPVYSTPVFGPITSKWSTLSTTLSAYTINAVDSANSNPTNIYIGSGTSCTHNNVSKRWFNVGTISLHPNPGEQNALYSGEQYCADFCTCNSNACPCDVDFTGGNSVNDQYTSLLMHFDNNIIDECAGVNLSALSTPTFSTAKFSQGINLKNTIVLLNNRAKLNMTSAWFMDFWIKLNASSSNGIIFARSYNMNNMVPPYCIKHDNLGNVSLHMSSNTTSYNIYSAIIGNIGVTNYANIGIGISGTTLYAFINGTRVVATTISGLPYATNEHATIGGGWNGTAWDYISDCVVDELRISQGVCRYTANYVPLTSPYVYNSGFASGVNKNMYLFNNGIKNIPWSNSATINPWTKW